MAELMVVTSRGFLESDDKLSGLFQTFAGGIDKGLDPIADATTMPGTFDPTCGLQISIVLKGGGCANALGWYNATQPPSMPTKIYPIIPADLTGAFPNGIGCTDQDFCPMAERDMNPGQAGQHTWADPLPAFDPRIASDPNWQGGPVGFAVIGNTGQCSQTKYSELELNQMSTKYGAPWITVLTYPSMAAHGATYLAFETSPMGAADWKQYGCDGDFNDDVYFVAPTPCAGGGGGASGVAGAGGIGGASGAAGGASGASGGASGAAGGAGGVSGAAGGTGGTAGGSGGQTSSTGGRVSTGGSPGTAGAAGASPAGNGGGGGCQTAGGGDAGPLSWLVLVALGCLRRRSRAARIRCS
jgi:hypothetical protein